MSLICGLTNILTIMDLGGKNIKSDDRLYHEEFLHIVYPSDVPDCVTLNLDDKRLIKRG